MNTHIQSDKLRSTAPYLSFQPRIRFVVCAILSLCLALTARAADITVTNTNDSGPGSLRQAIINLPGGGVIDFNIPITDPGYDATTHGYVITLSSTPLAITHDVTIVGPGANLLALSGGADGTPGHGTPVFNVSAGTAMIADLTITKGSINDIAMTGGALTLNRCVVSGANGGFPGAGAIFAFGGTLTLLNSSVSGNSTCPISLGGTATATISTSTISGNIGGGITTSSNSLTIIASTINGNVANTGGPSAIRSYGNTYIYNSTITQNIDSAPEAAGILIAGGSCVISHTIVANNGTRNVAGAFTSQGYNLIDNGDGSTGFGASGDIVGSSASPLNPNLGPLQDNGGPTFTQLPLPGSAAIDAGDPAFSVGQLLFDQRGYQRIANGRIDIGAVESGSYLNMPPVAVPGDNATAHAGTVVHLDGSASYDDNTPSASLVYAWNFLSKPAGSTAILQNASTATPSFTPDVIGDYVVQLFVFDNGTPTLRSAPAFVTLSSYNQAPTAVATASTNLPLLGQTVTLSSAGSSDPEGDAITYKWTLTQAPAGSHAVIASSTSPTATIKPDVKGTYVVTLTPSDFLGAGTPATATFNTTGVENYVHQQLLAASAVIAALPASQVTSLGNKLDFIYRLQHANKEMQHGRNLHAIIDIELDIIRTDGVPLRGKVDTTGLGRDWILSASAQNTVYGELVAARNALIFSHDCDDRQEIDNY